MASIDLVPEKQLKLPSFVLRTVVVISVAPFILNLLGYDFGNQKIPFDSSVTLGMQPNEVIDGMFHTLSGAFTHTILEWSAFSAAIFTVLLAFIYYSIKKDVTTPILGVALFCSGCMDAFHTLAADRLIEAVADNRNLIPFTWAICRVFNSLIMIVGVTFLMSNKTLKKEAGLRFVLGVSALFGIIAYSIIQYCATSAVLPQTMFPDSLITRPWDVIPLVLYLFAGLYLYPRFYKQNPGIFSHAMLVSIIPQVATEAHMAFGSMALFDNHFNVAHFLKIIAYLTPLVGLCYAYLRAFMEEEQAIVNLKQAQVSILKSEKKVRRILETAIDPIISIDEKGIILLCNPAAENEFGYSTVEMMGKNIKMLMPSPYKEEHDTYLSNYMKTGKAQIIGMIRELQGERKDGSVFPMELSVSEVLDDEQRSFTGVVRNITEHKEMIDELQQFAYITSHDLKAPLRAISNLSQWIAEDLGDDLDEETAGNLVLLRSRVQRMENLIQGVLQYSRAGSGEPTIVFCKLKEVIDGILDSIVVPEAFSIQIESDIIGIYADQTQIIQVFTNLISNAIKHNDNPQGKIRITARECETNKEWVEILVADNGPGIPMQYHEKVFQVFQTLQARDKVENTGVGLAIVKKIIEKQGGKIEILDLDTIGTTFKILWPNKTQ
ncbi:PAS domain S-box protein [Nitrospina gracilis]|nr:PAS domain S-box protein [Nitrospina gracilis]